MYMLQKIVSTILIIAVINLIGISHTFGASKNPESEALRTAKVKENIVRLGTGEKVRVKIKLNDNRKIEGSVIEATEESFTVKNLKTGETTEIAYGQVKKAKGNNLSTGAKIAIGVGILIAVAAIVFLTAKKPCENAVCR